MTEFNETDVTIEHLKLADGRGYLRFTHRPTGLAVDAHATSLPVIRVKQELMNRFREKVSAEVSGNGKGDGQTETATPRETQLHQGQTIATASYPPSPTVRSR
jgi:hypothetical protein